MGRMDTSSPAPKHTAMLTRRPVRTWPNSGCSSSTSRSWRLVEAHSQRLHSSCSALAMWPKQVAESMSAVVRVRAASSSGTAGCRASRQPMMCRGSARARRWKLACGAEAVVTGRRTSGLLGCRTCHAAAAGQGDGSIYTPDQGVLAARQPGGPPCPGRGCGAESWPAPILPSPPLLLCAGPHRAAAPRS